MVERSHLLRVRLGHAGRRAVGGTSRQRFQAARCLRRYMATDRQIGEIMRIDTRKMSLDELVAHSLANFDEMAQNRLIALQDLLAYHNATPEEVETELAHAEAEIAREREHYAETVRR